MPQRGRFKGKNRGNSHNKSNRGNSHNKSKRGGGFNKKNPSNSSKKRYLNTSPDSNLETVKRQKFEPPQNVQNEYSSSEEEDNYVDLLLGTINPEYVKKRTVAIETSDESESDEDQPNTVNEEPDVKETVAENEKEVEDQDEETEIDVETEKEEEDASGQSNDPFVKHLFYDLSESLLNSVQSTPMLVERHEVDWPLLGALQIDIPKCENNSVSKIQILDDSRPPASPGTIPKQITNLSDSLFIKSQIKENLVEANKCGKSVSDVTFLTPLQSEIFSIINNYQDFYFPQRTFDNSEEIRFVYSLHIANHILKTRTKILHHNAKLQAKDDVPEEFRDQGLVRPKVLVIVPFRDSAYRIIKMLIDIFVAEDKGTVINKGRFIEQFTGHEMAMPKRNPKPEDYQIIFSGNSGDDFKIGLTITKKSVKLFTDFYKSDIIIASPLGLRTIIGVEGEPERDYDFLASIELLIFDQMEIFTMQNWSHILHLMNHMHLQPKETHGADYFRVRTWSLNGLAKYYRQTLMFSSIVLPEFNAIFNRKCFNYAGKIKTSNLITRGSISDVFVTLPNVFQKIPCDDFAQLSEDRLRFFGNEVLPRHREASMKQTLVFISSYFEYVRLRNYFKRNDVDFVQACEYSKDNKVARARDMFFHGDAQFMLYTERFHFFNRVRVKGIRHLIFYQPPTFPHFYSEMCNLMEESNMNKKVGHKFNMTVTILYSKFDVIQLAAILGTERAATITQSSKSVHMIRT